MREVHFFDELQALLETEQSLDNVVVQSVDVLPLADELKKVSVQGTVFLGCTLGQDLLVNVIGRGAIAFPKLATLPFDPYRSELYSANTLFDGYQPANPCSYCETTDARVYQHWKETGGSTPASVLDALAHRLHDHAITDAKHDFLDQSGRRERTIAMMGGHAMQRTDAKYGEVARISRTLTRQGYLMASGGGPGAMEATHLGAWFADRQESELAKAIGFLAAKAPSYKDLHWMSSAFEMIAQYPPVGDNHISLGIPTWLYGHEPPTPFATHIAKYFTNSIREDGLISIATAGIVFAPGSAGTIQEVFQDATQNHYATSGMVSPMVFFGVKEWTEDKPIYPLLRKLAEGRTYQRLLAAFDTHDEIVKFFADHKPIAEGDEKWSFCGTFCK